MWFKRKINEPKSWNKPYLTKEIFWDNEKITQIRYDGTVREMYYKNIIRVEIIITDFDLPIPEWVIQDDLLDDHKTIHIQNDLKPEFTDLVIGMFNKKLEGYDNDEVHKKIIEAMGATLGLFHLWSRHDIDEILEKKWKIHGPILKAELDLALEESKKEEANVWWRKVLRFLKLIK